MEMMRSVFTVAGITYTVILLLDASVRHIAGDESVTYDTTEKWYQAMKDESYPAPIDKAFTDAFNEMQLEKAGLFMEWGQ